MNIESSLIRMTDQEFADLSGFVKERYGIDLTKKRVLIEGRLTHELNRRGLSSFSQYMDLVLADRSGAEITLLLNKLTTNLSFFMRENEHFEYLFHHALPYLEQLRAKSRTLRIWSAGCSTGQEPYNIAMVLDQYFGSRGSQWDTTILASDISMRVLSAAQQGIYKEEELKDISPEWKKKYFRPVEGGQFQVVDRLRKEVIFRSFNLMDPFPYRQPFDLIFCRNVMIYFDGDTKARLVQKFFDHTANGGFLFIGHSESLSSQAPLYTYLQPAIYQRRE